MYKLKEVQQDEQSYDAICSRTTEYDFVKFSKQTSTKSIEDKNLKCFNDFVQSGKNLFVNICFCYKLLNLDFKNST